MTSIPITVQERVPMPLGPGPRADGEGAGLSVGDVVRVLKQRMFLILFIWIFIVGLTIGATVLLIRTRPLFKAGSAIFVESPNPKTPMELERPMFQVELMDRWVADQVVRIKDPGFLMEVVESTAIQELPWFLNQPGDDKLARIDAAHTELVEDLSVKQISDTSYLMVSFRTANPQDAPLIVDMVIDKYLEKVRVESRKQYLNELTEYEEAETNLVSDLDRIRAEKQTMITSELGVPGVTEGLNIVGDTWRAYAERLSTYLR